jgi:hypothetical protein
VWAVREVVAMCFLILTRRGLCGGIGMGTGSAGNGNGNECGLCGKWQSCVF